MLAVLVGITNRTNWKKPNTQRRSSSITLQEFEHSQHTKRGRTNTARPFFLRIVRKGKGNNNHTQRATKTQRESNTIRKIKRQKKRQRRRKAGAKKTKRNANTPQAFNPPNSTRAQKPHKPRKARKQHKPTRNAQNPLKTPLKREIRPYSKTAHQRQSERADKRREHTTRGPEPASGRS